jgi:hypothetical protein
MGNALSLLSLQSLMSFCPLLHRNHGHCPLQAWV